MVRLAQSVRRGILMVLAISLVFSFWSEPVHAVEPIEIISTVPVQGTVEIKYTSGRIEVSTPLWTGNIPTRIRVIPTDKYQTCYELKFPIQAALPYDKMIDARSSVEIDFELWTLQGERVASEWIYSSKWSPMSGPTMVVWLECDEWIIPGNYNLVIQTKQTLSTTGLLSSYVKGMQTLTFIIDPPSSKANTVKCKKGKLTKTFKKIKCPSGWKAST